MTKAAVFDLDGVLLDSMGIWNDLGARYLRNLGVTPEEGLNEILFSMSMEQGAEYLHTHYALPQSAAEVGAGIADMLRDFYFYEVPAKDGAAALLAALTARGVKLVSGGTDNHLLLIDLTDEDCTGKELEHNLDEVHITANKNTVPGEKRSPFVTSGVRIGTPAVTTRGMGPDEMKVIADCIADCVFDFANKKDEVASKVEELTKKFPLYE